MQNKINYPLVLQELMGLLKPTFKVFVACENQAAYLQAQKALDLVEALCGQDCRISRVFWNFALLRQPELREHAVHETAGADMIVLSLGGSGELPPHVKNWMQRWPVRARAGRAVLVTLVDCAGEVPRDIAWLREMARSRGLEFFCNNHEQRMSTVPVFAGGGRLGVIFRSN